MKLAALSLLRENKEVIIETQQEKWTFRIEFDEDESRRFCSTGEHHCQHRGSITQVFVTAVKIYSSAPVVESDLETCRE